MTLKNELKLMASIVATSLAICATTAAADSGFYIGAAAGGANFEAEIGDIGVPNVPSSLDEDDTAIEFFAGYTFDLPLVDISAEIGYVDFGAPEIDVVGEELTLDTTGLNAWGIVTFNAGLIDLYGKLGLIAWEVDASIADVSASEDGTDLGYGVGAAFGLGPLEVRGEYEIFDLEDTDVSLLSVGVLYRF
ncbi:MAG: porin family protein [Pseudomonadota bacterium]